MEILPLLVFSDLIDRGEKLSINPPNRSELFGIIVPSILEIRVLPDLFDFLESDTPFRIRTKSFTLSPIVLESHRESITVIPFKSSPSCRNLLRCGPPYRTSGVPGASLDIPPGSDAGASPRLRRGVGLRLPIYLRCATAGFPPPALRGGSSFALAALSDVLQHLSICRG